MAYKNFDEAVRTLMRDVVIINLTVPVNAGANPVAGSTRGTGYTVTWGATGIYTFTPLPGMKFPLLLGIQAHLRLAAPGNTFAMASTYNSTTGVFTVKCVTGVGGAVEWPAANVDNVLSVVATFSNSSQLPQK